MRYAVDIVDELDRVRTLMVTDLDEAKEELQGIIDSIYQEAMEEFE